MKSIKNITKGIIKIHYTAPHLALNLHCSVTIYETILYIGPSVIVLHPLNKYFIQWGHNEKKVWKMSSYSIPSINTSYNEVTMRKDVKDVNTFIWCSSVSSLILFYIIPRIVNSSLKNIIMHVLFIIDICHMYFLFSIL
jgi:hypothetical protein